MSALFTRKIRFGLSCVGALIFAATPHLHAAEQASPFTVADRAGGALILSIDGGALQRLRDDTSPVIAGFPLPGEASATLRLERFDAFAPGARIVMGTARGDRDLPAPDAAFFRGRLGGDAASVVFLALSLRGVDGYIRTPGATFVLSSEGQGGSTTVFRPVSAAAEPPFCGGDHLVAPERRWVDEAIEGIVADDAPASAGCRAARIAIDTDWEFTGNLFGGDVQASSAYAATLLAAVSELYRRDLGVALQISYLRVWSENADPYTTSDAFDLLEQFRVHWNATRQEVERNLAFLLSGRQTVGSGGLAYLYGLCNTAGFGYGMSGRLTGAFPSPLQSNHAANWDVFITAHEIGHMFGAIHTHSMNPPVDQCGSGNCAATANQGTIMSSCHTCPGGVANIELTFHPRVISERIAPFLSAIACDLRTPPLPCLGDGDRSGIVDFGDLTATLANWGAPGPTGDANFNGAVNFEDLTFVLGNWSAQCPCP